jgi:7,8-dihydroneopterin aldolase/epimerase/oxygenase
VSDRGAFDASDGADVVAVRGLRATGRHGWYEHERVDGQLFVVDVELRLDTRAAAASDDLAETVDYGTLAADVVALVEGEPVRLVETLAQRVAERCLADPRVRAARVTVHKPQAPVAVPFDDVTVTVVRQQGRP